MAETHEDNHRTWKTLGGALLFLLGVAAFNAAAVTSVALAYTIGWILLIAGVVGFVMSFAIANAGGIVLGIVSAILSFVLGGLIIFNPTMSLVTLTFLMAMFFIVDGIIRIAVAIAGKTDHTGWSLFYGIVALLLGGAIWAHLPTSSLYIFGIFIGIGLIIKGITVLATSVTPLHVTGHRPRFA